MLKDFLYIAVIVVLCVAIKMHKQETKRVINSRDAYASMVGVCLEGKPLWDKLNRTAYFCSATPVRGL